MQSASGNVKTVGPINEKLRGRQLFISLVIYISTQNC